MHTGKQKNKRERKFFAARYAAGYSVTDHIKFALLVLTLLFLFGGRALAADGEAEPFSPQDIGSDEKRMKLISYNVFPYEDPESLRVVFEPMDYQKTNLFKQYSDDEIDAIVDPGYEFDEDGYLCCYYAALGSGGCGEDVWERNFEDHSVWRIGYYVDKYSYGYDEYTAHRRMTEARFYQYTEDNKRVLYMLDYRYDDYDSYGPPIFQECYQAKYDAQNRLQAEILYGVDSEAHIIKWMRGRVYQYDEWGQCVGAATAYFNRSDLSCKMQYYRYDYNDVEGQIERYIYGVQRTITLTYEDGSVCYIDLYDYLFGNEGKEFGIGLAAADGTVLWEFYEGMFSKEVAWADELVPSGLDATVKNHIYTVREGDTLRKIAQVYYGDMGCWEILYHANRIKIGNDPDILLPGTRLYLPKLITWVPQIYYPPPHPASFPKGG